MDGRGRAPAPTAEHRAGGRQRHGAQILALLLWKNFKLKLRRPKGAIAELVIPLFLFGLLAALRLHAKNLHFHDRQALPLITPSMSYPSLMKSLYCNKQHLEVDRAPDSTVFDTLVTDLQKASILPREAGIDFIELVLSARMAVEALNDLRLEINVSNTVYDATQWGFNLLTLAPFYDSFRRGRKLVTGKPRPSGSYSRGSNHYSYLCHQHLSFNRYVQELEFFASDANATSGTHLVELGLYDPDEGSATPFSKTPLTAMDIYTKPKPIVAGAPLDYATTPLRNLTFHFSNESLGGDPSKAGLSLTIPESQLTSSSMAPMLVYSTSTAPESLDFWQPGFRITVPGHGEFVLNSTRFDYSMLPFEYSGDVYVLGKVGIMFPETATYQFTMVGEGYLQTALQPMTNANELCKPERSFWFLLTECAVDGGGGISIPKHGFSRGHSQTLAAGSQIFLAGQFSGPFTIGLEYFTSRGAHHLPEIPSGLISNGTIETGNLATLVGLDGISARYVTVESTEQFDVALTATAQQPAQREASGALLVQLLEDSLTACSSPVGHRLPPKADFERLCHGQPLTVDPSWLLNPTTSLDTLLPPHALASCSVVEGFAKRLLKSLIADPAVADAALPLVQAVLRGAGPRKLDDTADRLTAALQTAVPNATLVASIVDALVGTQDLPQPGDGRDSAPRFTMARLRAGLRELQATVLDSSILPHVLNAVRAWNRGDPLFCEGEEEEATRSSTPPPPPPSKRSATKEAKATAAGAAGGTAPPDSPFAASPPADLTCPGYEEDDAAYAKATATGAAPQLQFPGGYINRHIHFAPNTGAIKELMAQAAAPIGMYYLMLYMGECIWTGTTQPQPQHLLAATSFVGYDTEEEALQASENHKSVLFTIIFHDINENGDLPEHLNYSLRAPEHLIPDTTKTHVSRFLKPGDGSSGWGLYYFSSAFATMTSLIDEAYILMAANKTGGAVPPVVLQQMPLPNYELDYFAFALDGILPLLLVLSWIYSVSIISKHLVYEKELKLKESMKMMGLPSWAHYTGWFLTALIEMTISATLLTITLFAGNILNYSNPLLIWLLLEAFAVATIALAFLISSFFSKAKLAAACAGIVYFALYLPYVLVAVNRNGMPLAVKLVSSLSSTTAFGLACDLLAEAEARQTGLQWSSMFTDHEVCNRFTTGISIVMLLVDAVLYFLIAWYVDSVAPGEYGIPRPWYFPFTAKFWCGTRSRPIDPRALEDDALLDIPRETDPDSPVLVSVNRIIKTYTKDMLAMCGGRDVLAVNDVSFNACQGRITALLGHNGAGKTTLMSIMTGLFPPSQGHVLVNGYNVETDVARIRRGLGVCPQHNVLWEDLTCEEHLLFCAYLKGLDGQAAQDEVTKYLGDLNLLHQRHTRSKALSGGQKRLLSVALSFVGGNQVVILDEPSAGMDPSARRKCWDILLEYRKKRAIIISTHHMDEADVLGDRIAIMSQGRLQCIGSSLFLKRTYDLGYLLTVSTAAAFDAKRFIAEAMPVVPSMSLVERKRSDVTFTLSNEDAEGFPKLLQRLETDGAQLHVEHYGVSAPTLERVFLRVMDEAQAQQPRSPEGSPSKAGSLRRGVTLDDDMLESEAEDDVAMQDMSFSPDAPSQHLDIDRDVPALTGWALRRAQLRGMFVKRYRHATRDYKAVFSQVLLPALFICLAMIAATSFPPRASEPALRMNFSDITILCKQTANYSIPFVDEVQSPYSRRFFETAAQQMTRSHNLSTDAEFQHPNGWCGYDCAQPNNLTSYLLDGTAQKHKYTPGAVSMETAAIPSLAWGYRGPEAAPETSFVRAWFNSDLIHTLPATLVYAHNTILKALLPGRSITVYNHPLKFSPYEKSIEYAQSGTDLTVAIFVIIAMSFVPASFAVFLVAERASKAKLLQFISGADPRLYWVTNYAWDLCNYLVPAAIAILVMCVFELPAYTGPNLPAVVVIFLLYGWAVTPQMYPFTFLFSVPSTAYIALICFNLFVGLTGTLTVFILDALGQDDPFYLHLNGGLKIALSIFPNFCLGRCMLDLAKNEYQREFAVVAGIGHSAQPFDWQVTGRYLLSLALAGPVYFLLVLYIEARTRSGRTRVSQAELGTALADDMEDDDVGAERAMAMDDSSEEATALRAVGLQKRYKKHRGGRKLAVRSLSFRVLEGECFGLLGVNGAGKTTTFKMLIGETGISSGRAALCGFDVASDLKSVHQNIGYVPQVDALCRLMTGRETLLLYGRLRGIPDDKLRSIIDRLMVSLSMEKYADLRSGTYSGGNKRKLSIAIAMLGTPSLILLDEPSAGLDPGAKRFLWRVVLGFIEEGRSVLLTSHAMDECEALCTRMGIMVNGSFRCLGTAQHLKTKYGRGYTLTIKSSDCAAAHVWLDSTIPALDLVEAHDGYREYSVPKESIPSLAATFLHLEHAKQDGLLSDYLLSQVTLESVFCTFAQSQRDTDPVEAAGPAPLMSVNVADDDDGDDVPLLQ